MRRLAESRDAVAVGKRIGGPSRGNRLVFATGVAFMHAVIVIICATMQGCSCRVGANVPGIAKPRQGENPDAYRNRVARELLAGVWEATWDNTDIIFPDGTNGGIETVRLRFVFSPTITDHGTLEILRSSNTGPFKPGGSGGTTFANWPCNSWVLARCETSSLQGCQGVIQTFPKECSDAPSSGPDHELMRMQLKAQQEMPKPRIEFVLQDDKTLLQTNGATSGGLQGELNLFEKVTWRKLGPGVGSEDPGDPSSAVAMQAEATQNLKAALDAQQDLLPPTFELAELYVSPHVAKFIDGTFDFALARSTAARFAMDAFSHDHEVGAIPAALLEKELKAFSECGYLRCSALVSRDEPLRAVKGPDGHAAVELSVSVVLKGVQDAVPSPKNSPFAKTLSSLVCDSHGPDSPLKYRTSISVSPQGDRFLIESHSMDGKELTTDNLKQIVQRNVMTLLSLEAVALSKTAATRVLFPREEQPRPKTASGASHERELAEDREGAEGFTEDRNSAKRAANSLRMIVDGLVAAVPEQLVGIKVHVALSRTARDQLRHGVLDVEFFNALGEVWQLDACRRRSERDYSSQDLATDAAAVIREFGVASVTCDLQIGKPEQTRSRAPVRIPVRYRIKSVDATKPSANSTWIAAATWAAIPGDGTLTLEFPVEEKQPGEWRFGFLLPTGTVFERDKPVMAWGEPVDVLSPMGISLAANRAVGEAVAAACERSLADVLAANPVDRIRQRGVLFGDAQCLPDAAPREQGIDLLVLSQIAEQVEAGSYWEKMLPAASPADRERVIGMLKRLPPVLKPRAWRSDRNERLVARPVFLSNSQVVMDRGEGNPRLPVERKAFDEDGDRLLGRIQGIAVDCVTTLNEVASSAGGVPLDQLDAVWNAVSEAASGMQAKAAGDSDWKALTGVAERCRMGEKNDSPVPVVMAIERVASQAAVVALLDRPTAADLASLEAAFGNATAFSAGPGLVVHAEALVASGKRSRGLEVLQKMMKESRSGEDRIEFYRAASLMGRVLLAEKKPEEALQSLQTAISIFKASRGDHTVPDPTLLRDFAVACMATGKNEAGEEALQLSRRALILTYGPDSLQVRQFEDRDTSSSSVEGKSSDP